MLVVTGCGGAEPEEPSESARYERVPVDLTIRVRPEVGEPRSAEVLCRGTGASATGHLAENPEQACRDVRELAPLLLSEPDPRAICAQIFGGRDRARITGTIGVQQVERELARRNSCEIAAWDRAAPILGEAPGS